MHLPAKVQCEMVTSGCSENKAMVNNGDETPQLPSVLHIPSPDAARASQKHAQRHKHKHEINRNHGKHHGFKLNFTIGLATKT